MKLEADIGRWREWWEKYNEAILVGLLAVFSFNAFIYFYDNGLGLAYNDARSHLDIGRRVVEGLSPGLAQLGSVWLPLLHVLIMLTVWNDFMWHSGLAGAIVSMISFMACGVYIYRFAKEMEVGLGGRWLAEAVFVLNLNILYLQSTAMTELLLLATMTGGVYELMRWMKTDNFFHLVKSAGLIFLATLTRYDGWFLLAIATPIVAAWMWQKRGWKAGEGATIMFVTLAGMGVIMWFGWNALIFKDPLYFMLGPFSAKAQQDLLENAGNLESKHNLAMSARLYFYALMYNCGGLVVIVGGLGGLRMWLEKGKAWLKMTVTALSAPLLFNILALYLGHSVLYVSGLSGNTWFNIRYGIMMMPALAVFIGFLFDRIKTIRGVIAGLLALTIVVAAINKDAVTLDDARVGSSQKNVTEVSGWLRDNAADREGLVLISAASHDAIIFSSGMPMKRFIHEGTGKYWQQAIENPSAWARWLVMRTHDDTDFLFVEIKDTNWEERYKLVDHYPFADVYELKD